MNSRELITHFVLLVVGLSIGAGLCSFFDGKVTSVFSFTNQTLDYGTIPEALTRPEQIALEEALKAEIEDAKVAGAISTASIYYRDLNNGPWIGINSTLLFSPASLLKVPLAMAVYAERQSDPGVLGQVIEFTGPRGTSVEHFPSVHVIEEGKQYTIKELIELMLKESDNDATMVLGQYLGAQKVDEVYTDLGVTKVGDYTKYSIDVRTYAYFFRALFNSYFIDRASSNELLEILSKSSFTKGLAAGIPHSVVVSHKFGERVIDQSEPLVQLHDCGIVYADNTPYILCVMTQGKDFEKLAQFIAEVSRVAYDAVSHP